MERTGDTDGRPQRWCLKGRHRISTRSRSGDLTVSPCPSVQVGVCLTVGSAGLDPNPSSEVFVICNDPGLCYPQAAQPRNRVTAFLGNPQVSNSFWKDYEWTAEINSFKIF